MTFLPYFDDTSVQSVGQIGPNLFKYFGWNSVFTGCFTSFSPLIALTSSSIVDFAFRAVLTLRFYMFPARRAICPPEH